MTTQTRYVCLVAQFGPLNYHSRTNRTGEQGWAGRVAKTNFKSLEHDVRSPEMRGSASRFFETQHDQITDTVHRVLTRCVTGPTWESPAKPPASTPNRRALSGDCLTLTHMGQISIVLDGLRGVGTIAGLCRREGNAQGPYHHWS